MMSGTSKTRMQRRMEKRQTLFLLLLVLLVSLASFTLGVVVGRRGAERELVQKSDQREKIQVVKIPAQQVKPEPDPPPVAENATSSQSAEEEPKLSFYDDLAKESASLGSGINLAPMEEAASEEAVSPPIDLPEKPIVKNEAEDIVVAVADHEKREESTVVTMTTTVPTAVANGSHTVQIGSFGAVGDAIALKQKMVKKEYPAFVVEADLGKKGLWYRVKIGPYADSSSAKKVQQVLEEKEQIKGFVSRR